MFFSLRQILSVAAGLLVSTSVWAEPMLTSGLDPDLFALITLGLVGLGLVRIHQGRLRQQRKQKAAS